MSSRAARSAGAQAASPTTTSRMSRPSSVLPIARPTRGRWPRPARGSRRRSSPCASARPARPRCGRGSRSARGRSDGRARPPPTATGSAARWWRRRSPRASPARACPRRARGHRRQQARRPDRDSLPHRPSCYAVRAKPGPPHWGLTAASRLRPQTPNAGAETIIRHPVATPSAAAARRPRAPPAERDDLLLLAAAMVAVPLGWLLLGWRWPLCVSGYDAWATSLPLLQALGAGSGDWDALAYRPDLLGGARLRDTVGPNPLVALLARAGLSATGIVQPGRLRAAGPDRIPRRAGRRPTCCGRGELPVSSRAVTGPPAGPRWCPARSRRSWAGGSATGTSS